MNPFYFGPSDRPLFGVYTPPRGRSTGATGVVLCYPVGSEYLRAHRAFRQLATLLVRAGLHVLRFDYFGTGDSAGDPVEASVEGWTEDIATAIQEMKDSAGLNRVSLGGLRLGGTLAVAAGLERDDVDAIVLWDPVLRGRDHLASLDFDEPTDPIVKGGSGGFQSSLPPGTLGSGGFPMTERLRREIEEIDLSTLPARRGAAVDVLVSSPHAELDDLAGRWKGSGLRASYQCIPSEGDWAQGDRFGSALIPQDIIQGVVASLTRQGGA